MSRRTVVVMGAGPAGLSAAHVLSRNGVRAIVCERSGVVGGLARTVQRGHYRFDIGGHRFFTKSDRVFRLVRDLLGDEMIEVDRRSRILFRGKFLEYPLTLRSSLLAASPPDFVGIPFSYAAARFRARLCQSRAISFEDWGVNRFGRRMFELFFRPYTEKIWGIPCTRLSADWAGQRIRGMSLKAALSAILLRGRDSGPKSMIRRFHYFRKGFGRVSERLADEVLATGEVLLESPVIRVHHDTRRIRGVTVRRGQVERRIDADSFVSSIPITELVRLLEPEAPERVTRASRRLGYRDLITVHLMLNRSQVTPDHWVYIPDPDIGFARFHEPGNWSPEMAPDGKTSLVVEYFSSRGDPLWAREDANLIDRTVRDLSSRLNLIEPHEVADAFVLRHPHAYPVYDIGYRGLLRQVVEFLSGFGNLHLVGRCGMFRYNNTDHAIETGIKAAENIMGASHDLFAVNLEDEYLEER